MSSVLPALEDKSGAKVELSALSGKVVALYFSSHW
jgi:cytochrome oxidase Cu insertion factor (SCO1/SenC/PrrC family)